MTLAITAVELLLAGIIAECMYPNDLKKWMALVLTMTAYNLAGYWEGYARAKGYF